MWGAAESSFGGGGGGGGFMDSPAGGDKQAAKTRRSQNIMPVTCQQILNCTEDAFKLEGFEANLVTVVGLVKKLDSGPLKLSMWIDDQTASLQCVHYFGGENSTSNEPVMLCEGSYGRVIGALRTTKGSRYIIIFKTIPVDDLNEMTYHLMEVIHNGMKLRKMRAAEEEKSAGSTGKVDNTFGSSMIASGLGAPTGSGGGGGTGGFTTMPGFTAHQTFIVQTIRSVKDESGMHRDDIVSRVTGRMTKKEALEALEFLSNEGHIYSTVDDDHFSATDVF